MRETELRTELEQASAHLRPHLDAQTLWERGVRARRRDRALAVGGTIAAATALVVGGVTVQTIDSTAPDPRPPATDPTPPDDPEVSQGWIPAPTKDQVEPAFGYHELVSAPWDDASSARSWDPVDPTPLADNPVEHAGLAVTSDESEPDAVYVLDDDGRWRSLDMDDLSLVRAPGASQVPASVALSPDGTRLAVGQAGGAVVVDLTIGDRTTYDVPGLGAKPLGRDVIWSPDSETLYVDSLARSPAHAVSLATGETAMVDFPPRGRPSWRTAGLSRRSGRCHPSSSAFTTRPGG